MQSLIKKIGVKNEIKIINAKNLEDAIKNSFKDDEYKFFLNSELIDINDRFRIFNFNNINYIIKKTCIEDGRNEVNLAESAYKKLNGKKVNNLVINVLKPLMIEIGNDAYIVTEYMGVSLQEILYSSDLSNSLDLQDLFYILDEFKNLGIVYRGFLPRNTIINGNNIYLLDWEDAVFNDKKDFSINYFWETNFLLNWGYLYDIEILKNKLISLKKNDKEPELVKYEKNFCEWINFNNSINGIRKKIIEIVFFAEKPIKEDLEEFYIMPNDLAHLISDLYNSDIDVLFDITCFLMRRTNELLYKKLVVLLSNNIVDSFVKKENVQVNALNLLIFIFECVSLKMKKELVTKLLTVESENDLFDIIKQISDFKLTNCLLNNSIDKDIFIETFEEIIKKYNGTIPKQNKLLKLYDYIIKIKEG